jgi:hypothetical protein
VVQQTGAAHTCFGAFEIWKKGTLKNIWMAGLGRDDYDANGRQEKRFRTNPHKKSNNQHFP